MARKLIAEHGTALRDVAVVLPSQRAGLYLRKWLAEEAGSPLWSPQVFTIGTFMEERSGLRALAVEELLFEGYEAYRAVEGANAQPFGEFLQWAGTTLADISEADAHLVPLESYYRDLRSWEEIEWTFNNDPLSQGQQRMVRFWVLVGLMHTALNTRLLVQGAGTTGLIERTAATRAVSEGRQWNAVWFAGLNALTPAQEALLRRFREADLARIAWDIDEYYFADTVQEAGQHLRKAVGAFGPGLIPMSNRLAEGRLQLRTIRAPNNASQGWCAAEILKNDSAENRARTAVVLADESLLQPLLEALPTDIGPLNITMGLPVARLAIGSYLEALHRLHAGMRAGTGFFHADVERFLGHPFLRVGPTAAVGAQVLAELRKNGSAYIRSPLLCDLFDVTGGFPKAAHVFKEVLDVRTEMPEITAQALAWAMHAMDGDELATEQIYQASLVLRKIHLLLVRYAHVLDIRSYSALFHRLLGSARIGLFGEPLAGVQVMGMLEARALDPARVIVLGAQEGSLPAGGAEKSFIPFELRRAHGMPLRDGNDAVQAYNFLRMLQRAEEAVLVWPEGAEPTGPSRFILQLEHELFKGKNERLKAFDARIRMPQVKAATVRIAKDAAVLEAVRGKLRSGLSPSALGDWLRCPLDFHFKHVMGLKQVEEVDTRIAANTLGEALHGAVEATYRPWLGKPLQASWLLGAEQEVEGELLRRLAETLSADGLQHGQPLLQVRMAVHAAQRFLHNEADVVARGAVITPLALEVPLTSPLDQAALAIGSPVSFKGRIDRVDRCNAMVRILDLKSGKVDPAHLSIPELTLDVLKGDKRYAAQLLVYAWLYLKEHPEVDELQTGILPLQRAASSEPLLMQWPEGNIVKRTSMPKIEELLTEVVLRMMDPTMPIEHDPKSKYCSFCLGAR
ncbi:MAG: PD-(D/E)XK nuclease family protein [Flavobacteriales bacterium]